MVAGGGVCHPAALLEDWVGTSVDVEDGTGVGDIDAGRIVVEDVGAGGTNTGRFVVDDVGEIFVGDGVSSSCISGEGA